MTTKTKPDITLANGRVVEHTLMSNGATSAELRDGGCMSHAEYANYLAIVAAQRSIQRVAAKTAGKSKL